MSRKARNRVCYSPDMYDHNPTIFLKHNRGTNRRRAIKIWSLRLRLASDTQLMSPVKLLRRFGAKVARALQFVSITTRSSRKVSSSSSAYLTRSRSLVDPIDESHRAEAIEDCIEFLNSSSSFHRSNSVSGRSC